MTLGKVYGRSSSNFFVKILENSLLKTEKSSTFSIVSYFGDLAFRALQALFPFRNFRFKCYFFHLFIKKLKNWLFTFTLWDIPQTNFNSHILGQNFKMAIIIPCRGQQNSFKTLGPIGSVLTFIKSNK